MRLSRKMTRLGFISGTALLMLSLASANTTMAAELRILSVRAEQRWDQNDSNGKDEPYFVLTPDTGGRVCITPNGGGRADRPRTGTVALEQTQEFAHNATSFDRSIGVQFWDADGDSYECSTVDRGGDDIIRGFSIDTDRTGEICGTIYGQPRSNVQSAHYVCIEVR